MTVLLQQRCGTAASRSPLRALDCCTQPLLFRSSNISRRVLAAAQGTTEPLTKAAVSERTSAAQPTPAFLSKQNCMELLSRVAEGCAPWAAEWYTSGPSGGVSAEARLISQLLEAMYDEVEKTMCMKRGYLLSNKEAAMVAASGGSPTYGEITGEGIQQFLRSVPLAPDDVLVDLGSGIGRLPMQVAGSVRICRCVGIELAPSRHEQAEWVLRTLRTLEEDPVGDSGSNAEEEGGPLLLTGVEFRCEDMMTADLDDGTVFFMCSTAFSSAAVRTMTKRLASHPTFRLLVTSRALPFPGPLVQLGQFPCTYSWTDEGTAYVYVRSLGTTPPGLLAAFLADREHGVAWLPGPTSLALTPGDILP